MVVISLIVSVLAGIAAGWIVYFALSGGLRTGTKAMKTQSQTKTLQAGAESLVDRMGVVCFRIANRVVISTLGGALLVLMLGRGAKRA